MSSAVEFVHVEGDRYHALCDGRVVGIAYVHDEGNYVQALRVSPGYRRRGIAIDLVRFIATHRGRRLTRAPDHIKNDKIRALSRKLGDEMDG